MKGRAWVWLGLGAMLLVLPLVLGRPLVLRGTRIPWGLVVITLGLMLWAWDRRGG